MRQAFAVVGMFAMLGVAGYLLNALERALRHDFPWLDLNVLALFLLVGFLGAIAWRYRF